MDQLCMDALARWKATLPKQDRLILISHHLDGLTPAEVAAVLDLSEGYVLRRLHHLQQDLLQTVRRGPSPAGGRESHKTPSPSSTQIASYDAAA